MKIRGVVLEQTGGPLTVSPSSSSLRRGPRRCSCGYARAASATPTGTRSTGLGDRVPGRARSRGSGRRRGGRRRRHARGRRRPRRALLDALVRRVRGVRARPSATVLDRVAGDGNRRDDGRDAAAFTRRRADLPLLLPLDLRGRVRRARALVRPDRRRTSRSRSAALVGCAVSTGVGAVWRTAGVQAGDRVAIIGCGGVGLSALMAAVAVGAEPVVAVDAAPQKLEVARSFGATDCGRVAGKRGGDRRGGARSVGRWRRLRDRGDGPRPRRWRLRSSRRASAGLPC